MFAGGDQARKSEDPGEQNLADHLAKGKPWHEIEALIREDRRNCESESGQREGR